jgi:hypothetical protein
MALDQSTIEALDPGIKQFVIALNEAGFTTTDSGDGTFKFEPGSEYDPIELIPFPHVIARTWTPEALRNAAPNCKPLARRKEQKDLMHPYGRCKCGGEGRCEWCQRAQEMDEEESPMRVIAALMEFEEDHRHFHVKDAAYRIKDILESIEPKMLWRVELVWDTDGFDADDEGWLFMAIADSE